MPILRRGFRAGGLSAVARQVKSRVSPHVVWRFSDGKAGHDNQSQGLAGALNRLRPVEIITLDPLPAVMALSALGGGQRALWRNIPAPGIVLGAGHRTHLSLLAARRMRGGKAIVLMRPSLPLCLFDLCLIPAHDAPPARPNVTGNVPLRPRYRPCNAPKSLKKKECFYIYLWVLQIKIYKYTRTRPYRHMQAHIGARSQPIYPRIFL